MNNRHDRKNEMGIQDFFNWHPQQVANMETVADEDLAADVDEPPDNRRLQETPFHKSTIRPKDRTESLLTKALHSPAAEPKPDIHVAIDLSRRRSMISNASLASTAELTSDGGLTSPARTNTPSPPIPRTTYTSFAPYSFAAKVSATEVTTGKNLDPIKPISHETACTISVPPTTKPPVEFLKKRSISFACGGRKDPVAKPAASPAPVVTSPTSAPIVDAPKRKCMIKFACGNNPKPSTEKPSKVEIPKAAATTQKAVETQRRTGARSPSMTRKSLRPTLPSRPQRESSSSSRRGSQNPVAVRSGPKYIDLDEKTLQSSEATRFHEFASEEMQEDDWIRRELDNPRERLTINDTLKMENDIRRLGDEAEEEALEDEEDEDRDENDSDDNEDDEDLDDDASDGNETDNEAGFADSDEESDGDGDFAFWTPGRNMAHREIGEATTYRASAHRTVSASSIDSLDHMSPPSQTLEARTLRRRPIKIRPGTPDLPDSTDFVCGTLDEDRPLEDAYVSCMEARKNAKHRRTPQDIDPSFPISEPEEEEEDKYDNLEPANDSDENVWLHGKFEDSDEELKGRHRSVGNRHKSPALSPRRLRSPPPPGRRLHSPPPTKTRLRSPPPRKLFNHSPKRLHSPPPARSIRSPAASPTYTTGAITFAPLGSRPGLTHTKSLPRAPNAFCRQYRASRIAAANGNNTDGDVGDGHVRGAMDIVKGLENKRQRRKEKLYRGKGKCHTERKPLPGKGAERMREVGLHMAGKTGAQAPPYMLSA